MVRRIMALGMLLSMIILSHTSLAQSALVKQQLKNLCNPKGWVVHSVSVVSGEEPVQEELQEWNECLTSSLYTFNANGTYTLVYGQKNCPDMLLKDVKGTWTYKTNSAIRDGIIMIDMQNSAIDHDWSKLHVLSISETTMMAVNSASYNNKWEDVWIWKIKGTQLPVENVFQEMPETEQDLDLKQFFTEAELKAANTTAKLDYLTKDERLFFLHTNLVRMYPAKYRVLVERVVNSRPDWSKSSTLADKKYYGSLLSQLSQQKPLPPLQSDPVLYEQAACWAKEMGDKGIYGHDRVECVNDISTGENCVYGQFTAHEMLITLLIDSDVESFGHRKNILNPGYSKIGIAIHPHRSMGGLCAVQDFQ